MPEGGKAFELFNGLDTALYNNIGLPPFYLLPPCLFIIFLEQIMMDALEGFTGAIVIIVGGK